MIRRVGAAATLVMALLAFLTATAGPAAAHATLVSTTPPADAVVADPPSAVSLTFSEPVDVGLGGVKVFDPDGKRVERGTAELDADGTTLTVDVDPSDLGTHTVVWSVTSEDNHTISGTVLFSVEAVTGAADVADDPRSGPRLLGGIGRAIAFGGTIAFVGLLAFELLILRGLDVGPDRLRRLRTTGLAAGAAIIAGSMAALWAQVAISSGRSLLSAPSLVVDAVRETRFGALGVARIALGVAAVAVVALQRPAAPRLPRLVIGSLLATGLVVVPALTGHAWSTTPRPLAVAVDALHLTATAVWIGGLLAALVVGSTWLAAGTMLRNFSRVALVSVVAVISTGMVSSYLQVRSLDALTGTGYGVLLLVKVAAVAILVGLGFANRRRLASATADAGGVLRIVRIEAVVAAVVIAITATLVNRPPARADLLRPFSGVEELAGFPGSVQVEVQPGKVGTNDVHLYFLDEQGAPAPIDAAEVTVGREGIPPRLVKVTPITADHASAYAVSFPSPGEWTITVTAARAGQDGTAEFKVPVR